MRKTILLVAGAASIHLGVNAQTSATLTNGLDVAVANVGSVFTATYSIADNKFLASNAGTAVRIYNGTTGAYESDLNLTGVSTPGLGVFSLACGTDGSIFAFTDAPESSLWQWDNVADATATRVTSGTVAFSRSGHVIGTGVNTKVALTGEANQGTVRIYSTTDDVSYTLFDTVPGNPPDALFGSKSSFAINSALNKVWGTGDTSNPIRKSVKTGPTWAGVAFTSPAGSASAAGQVYDSVNKVLFTIAGTTVNAVHGESGLVLATRTITNGLNVTPGYCSAVVIPTLSGGTLAFAGRGVTASNVSIHKLTYTVTPDPTAAADWSMYE